MYTTKLSNILLFLFLISISACKKDNIPASESPISPTTGTRTQFTLDSIYLYAKQIYIWSSVIPAYDVFNPRAYTTESSDLANFKKELFNISQLKLNPLTGYPYEEPLFAGSAKYSSISTTSGNSTSQSLVTLQGTGYDYGFEWSVLGNEIWINLVHPGSAAYVSGLTRGCRVNSINGATATIALANSAMNNSTISLSVQKPDSTFLQLNLSPSGYTANPVLVNKIITVNSTKIGYIAYNSFSSLSNSQAALDQAFSTFAAANITNLIIDLRYNSGGYTATAEYMANLVAPTSINGKVIYSEQYNALMQSGQATILKNQPYLDENNKSVLYQGRTANMADVDYSEAGNTYKFSKKGRLETVQNIYFIVSGTTASASELLINSLKPYFKVKLIGTQTYGKPIGFFGINIDRYQIYLSSFLIRNSAGTADYFSGIPVDIVATDDITHNFGDPAEDCLSKTLLYINTGSITGNTKPENNITLNSRTTTSSLRQRSNNLHGITGALISPHMIETRYHLKK